MVDNRSKKLKVEKNLGEEYIDEELILSFEKFQEVQEELAEINEKQSNEVLKVEQQYHEIRKTIYDKRNQIIKTLPNFWLKAFMSHPVLNDILNHEEREMIKYMSDLEVEDNKDVGYTITFNFNPNPYFENEKLTKAFTILEDGTTKITTTPIKWKEGKGIINGVDHDWKRYKHGALCKSFFHWFSDCMQQDDMHGIHDEVAKLIKDDLWPNPFSYLTNEDDEEDEDKNDEE